MSNYFIHKTSVLDEETTVGLNTKIWHFCHISKGAIIGSNCVLGQNTFIGENVKIGNNVKIQNNVSIFEGVEIKDNVFIAPSVVFTNILTPRAFINKKNKYVNTLVKIGATIGANSTIICGNTIGEYSLVGAGSVVTKSVDDYAKVFGNPAVFKGYIKKDI